MRWYVWQTRLGCVWVVSERRCQVSHRRVGSAGLWRARAVDVDCSRLTAPGRLSVCMGLECTHYRRLPAGRDSIRSEASARGPLRCGCTGRVMWMERSDVERSSGLGRPSGVVCWCCNGLTGCHGVCGGKARSRGRPETCVAEVCAPEVISARRRLKTILDQ